MQLTLNVAVQSLSLALQTCARQEIVFVSWTQGGWESKMSEQDDEVASVSHDSRPYMALQYPTVKLSKVVAAL